MLSKNKIICPENLLKIAKSKGGSNTDVVLQKKRDNRQWQEDYEHNQQ